MVETPFQIDTQEAQRTLLFAATEEDHFGLYSEIWELNSRFPDVPLGEKHLAADTALRSLHAKGFIGFHRELLTDSYRTKGHEPIDPTEVEEMLSNPVSWYPDYNFVRIVYCITETGEHAYYSQTRGKT
ncbi:MAG: hypothetical protein AAF495_28825 [Pseudomonadota bacterium]